MDKAANIAKLDQAIAKVNTMKPSGSRAYVNERLRAVKAAISADTDPAPAPDPEPDPVPDPPPPPPSSNWPPAGFTLLKMDPMSEDPIPFWRGIGADRRDGNTTDSSSALSQVSEGRVVFLPTGGPTGGPARRLTVKPGDDCWGERTELGENDARDTVVLYNQGETWITEVPMKLVQWPVALTNWQIVFQMKQCQPHPPELLNGSPVIALEVNKGQWHIKSHGEQVKAIYGAGITSWVNFAFEVKYDLSGYVQPYLNHEPLGSRVDMRTLATAKSSGGLAADGGPYAAGEAIRSSMRLGPYHGSDGNTLILDVGQTKFYRKN